MAEARWLDRALILSPYFTLCTSESILNRTVRKLKATPTGIGLNSGAGATTNFLKNEKGEAVAIVCLYDHSYSMEQIFALLAHEAVHIFQHTCEAMNEDLPSIEFQAWSVQKIAQELFYEYRRQVPGVKMSSKKTRKRFNRRDRRKAKQTNWRRPGRSNPKKVGHGGSGQK